MTLTARCTYIYGIAVGAPRADLGGQTIIVLVEEGLTCGVEVQAIRCSLVRQLVARECLDLGEELAGLDEHATQRLKVFEALAVLQQWGFGPSHLEAGAQRAATREEELSACRE